MDPVATALTVAGWLISAIISRFLTKVVEDWAKLKHLGTEVQALKDKLQQIEELLDDAKGMTISSHPLLQSLSDLQQKVYDADDLLDDLDYYRLQDLVENKKKYRNEVILPASKVKFFIRDTVSALKQKVSCRSGANVLASEPGSSEPRPRLIREDMSDKINNVVKELDDIYGAVSEALNRRKTDKIVTAIKSTAIKEVGTTACYDKNKVVGRDKVKLDLVQLLTSESSSDESLHVIPIVGHGGVGKTTLAQMVCDDPKVRKYFNFRMWIWVSSTLDVHDLTMQMLGYISGEDHANKSLSHMQDIIVDSLKSNKVLLVVDNLWENMDKERWETLILPFRNMDAKGKRIVVTTRYPSVAAQVGTIGTIQPVNLHGLEGEDCKSLFKKCAFGSNNPEFYPNLLKIGEEIITNLKGYPLEIVTVGAVLSEKLDAGHWIKVRDNDEWKKVHGNNSQDHIMASLKLGYQYLSCELQQCFSTCSLFPKNFKFNGEDLISLWIAQGFISAKNVEQSKQLESESLNKLVGRGFLQEVREKDENEQGTVVYYIMHDLMHDLAAMVSEEFLTIEGHGIKFGSSWSKTRHLSIITSFAYGDGSTRSSKQKNFMDELGKIVGSLEVQKLRTLILIGNYDTNFAEKISGLFQSTKCLRAIILTTGKFHVDHLLRNISNLLHLRYLKLESGKFSDCKDSSNRSTVPQSLCWLYHLETLDVKNWENVFDLPRLTHCLVNLRRVHANKRQIGNISEVGRLEKLEELREFTVSIRPGFNVSQLGNLNKLGGVLRIYSLENIISGEEAAKAKIMNKAQLQDLSLYWSERRLGDYSTTLDLQILQGLQPPEALGYLTIGGYAGKKCPRWMATCSDIVPHLKSIHLSGCVNLKELPPLGELPVLEKLHLEGLRSITEVNPEFYGSSTQTPFDRLKEVVFCKMDGFANWHGPDRGSIFPSLERLKIIGCPRLLCLPLHSDENNHRFPCLKELVIESCQEIVLPPLPHAKVLQYISVRNVQEDPYKSLLMSSRFLGQLSMSILWNTHQKAINADVLVFSHLCALTELTIEDCPDACLPWEGFQHLKSLKKLVLRDSQRRQSGIPHSSSERLLPTSLELLEIYLNNVSGRQLSKWLLHLPSLHTLVLTSSDITCLVVDSLTNESNLIISRENSPVDEGLLQIFSPRLQSLRELKINKCINLVSLITKNEGFGGFPSLQKLTITNCSKVLASLEIIKQSTEFCIFPQSLELLEVDHITEILQSKLLCNLSNLRYLKLDWSPTVRSLVMDPLKKLEELNIASCKELSFLKGVCSLNFLKRMRIIKCPGLARALEYALDSEKHSHFSLPLEVLIVDDLSFLREKICKRLRSLKKFVLDDADQEALSEEEKKSLKMLTSLQQIDFKNCPNLQSLPNELDKLYSLNILRIISCPKIQSVPENLELKEMHIYSCGNQLEEMCKNLEKVKRLHVN